MPLRRKRLRYPPLQDINGESGVGIYHARTPVAQMSSDTRDDMASESQQWYIEEIPAIEQDEEPSDVACGCPPVSVESEAGGTAPKAFITLDTGTAATLDTPQSKGELTVGSADTVIKFCLRVIRILVGKL